MIPDYLGKFWECGSPPPERHDLFGEYSSRLKRARDRTKAFVRVLRPRPASREPGVVQRMLEVSWLMWSGASKATRRA